MTDTGQPLGLDHDVGEARRLTQVNQGAASDPASSAWVSANAGTGKTYVLTQRVLRLLLSNTAPERLLCLTYTKTAAAEMSKRVFARLADWVVLEQSDLDEELADLLSRPPTRDDHINARTLFARAIETPGGLKVQTIHAFCERLLQRFPLEAGIAPHFAIIDEVTQKELLGTSVDAVLHDANSGGAPDLAKALGTVSAHAGDERFEDLLRDVLNHRSDLNVLIQDASPDEPFADIAGQIRTSLGGQDSRDSQALEDAMADILDKDSLQAIEQVLATGAKSDIVLAGKLSDARGAKSAAIRSDILRSVFLTDRNAPRKRLMTKGLVEDHPALFERFTQAQAQFFTLFTESRIAHISLASAELLRLGDAVIQHYVQAKLDQAVLDYDDLIDKTNSLLSSAGEAQWVLYKLDQGLDHILVDEAQDTSPKQWQIVERIAEEFFSGQGASDTLRTVFAVGDEKQSIYSFQGARPEKFAAVGKNLAALVSGVGQDLNRVPLNVSFRSVPVVLKAVDLVFSGLPSFVGKGDNEAMAHISHRSSDPGLVEIWPIELPQEVVENNSWNPYETGSVSSSSDRLAIRIARTIKQWIEDGEALASTSEVIRAGDILILVRKRRPFVAPLIRALKQAGLSVAGADRIRVTGQIAVMDLMALGAFLLLTEDDLSLAAVLKSPLFGIDEEQLFDLAHGRSGTLWQALTTQAVDDPQFASIAETLKHWRARADYAPPYEFYSMLLDEDGRREAMLAQLGPEAGDAIDEFLNLALEYDSNAPPTLQGFLEWLERADPEIRRDMEQGRDEIRIMTIHGAKGLEAPIVFLPDTCTTRGGEMPGGVVALADESADDSEHGSPLVWRLAGASELPAVRAANELRSTWQENEYQRLLYVAMTRARDRLYVCGFQSGVKSPPDGCWYNLVSNALQSSCDEAAQRDGNIVWRMGQVLDQVPPRRSPGATEEPVVADEVNLPEWINTQAPGERQRVIPIAPSRIMPLQASELESDQQLPLPLSPLDDWQEHRFRRGDLIHRLLQYLPEIAADRRADAAAQFLERRANELDVRARTLIADETLAVLNNPEFDDLFGPYSQAEVPIVGEFTAPSGDGPRVRINGQIDRLVHLDGIVRIVDFKTNRNAPNLPQDVAPAYLLQLAAYRFALREIFPGERVETALLWTEQAAIMAIPAEFLDKYENKLWTGARGLDG